MWCGPAGRQLPLECVNFPMLMVGYLVGIDSERATAWRCRDSILVREFFRYGLAKARHHSTPSRTRKQVTLPPSGQYMEPTFA